MGSGFNKGRTGDKKSSVSIGGIVILLAAFLLLGGPQILTAASSDAPIAASTTAPPQIKADKTVYDVKNSSAEFIGNVIITQGATVTTADNVKVFFKTGGSAELSLDENSFEKIIASGNVKIVTEDGVATADKAVYDSAADSLVLTGNPATYDADKISMSSSEIVVYGIL